MPSERSDQTAEAPRTASESVCVHKMRDQVLVLDASGRPIESCRRFLERYAVRGLSKSTIEAYAYDLALIHRWLEAEGVAVDAVGEDLLHRFIAGSAPATANRRASTVACTRCASTSATSSGGRSRVATSEQGGGGAFDATATLESTLWPSQRRGSCG